MPCSPSESGITPNGADTANRTGTVVKQRPAEDDKRTQESPLPLPPHPARSRAVACAGLSLAPPIREKAEVCSTNAGMWAGGR